MSVSSEQTGGEGFNYEGFVAAYYLAALAAESSAVGCEGTVVRVSVQQRRHDHPLDDVILHWRDASEEISCTSLQVKRKLTISAAITNTDFREVIRDSWETYKSDNFVRMRDRFGAAFEDMSTKKKRYMDQLCALARSSPDAHHFDSRFKGDKSAGESLREIKDDIETLLQELCAGPLKRDDVHGFLSHFILIRLELLHEGAPDMALGIHLLRCIVDDTQKKSLHAVWSHLYALARRAAGSNGIFERSRLVHELSKLFRLQAAPSFRKHISAINTLAQASLQGITEDINGFRLYREVSEQKLEQALLNYRCVQISGLPGAGKSVLLKSRAEQAREKGTTFFIRSDLLSGLTWAQYATSLGMPVHRIEDLLVEIAATGTAVLFIDGIDHVAPEQRGIVEEIVSVILHCEELSGWKILFSRRDTTDETFMRWLSSIFPHDYSTEISVGPLSDDEAKQLGRQFPGLMDLLFSQQRIREIIRRPFFARIIQSLNLPASTVLHSELDLIRIWWERGGYNAKGRDASNRRHVLASLAERKATEFSKKVRISAVDANGEVESLCHDGILRLSEAKLSVEFRHDIFFEWALFYVLLEEDYNWVSKLKASWMLPLITRAVELLAQDAFDKGDWENHLNALRADGLPGSWMRAWLTGPLHCPDFSPVKSNYHSHLMAESGALLMRMINSMLTEKTIPNPLLLAFNESQEKAEQLSWPSDFRLWKTFISYLNDIKNVIKSDHYVEVLRAFRVWYCAAFAVESDVHHMKKMMDTTLEWLLCAENMSTKAGYSERALLAERLARQIILDMPECFPETSKSYLKYHIDTGKIPESVFIDVIKYSNRLSAVHPALLVDFTLTFLIEPLPVAKEDFDEFLLDRAVFCEMLNTLRGKPQDSLSEDEKGILNCGESLWDGGLIEDSSFDSLCINDAYRRIVLSDVVTEPMASLLKFSANEGLRLLAGVSNHAVDAWCQRQRISGYTPLPVALQLPWGNQKFWGDDTMYQWGSQYGQNPFFYYGYQQLKKWLIVNISSGEAIDSLTETVLKNNNSVAVLSVVADLLRKSRAKNQIFWSLLSSQRVLMMDKARFLQMQRYSGERRGSEEPLENSIPQWYVSREWCHRVREAIMAFSENLAWAFIEDKEDPSVAEALYDDARYFQQFVTADHYRLHHASGGKIEYVFELPRKQIDADLQREADTLRNAFRLCQWANNSLMSGIPDASCSPGDAIEFVNRLDHQTIFTCRNAATDILASAVAGVAAVVMCLKDEVSQDDIAQALKVFDYVMAYPICSLEYDAPDITTDLHPCIYLIQACRFMIDATEYRDEAIAILLSLLSHQLNNVAKEAFKVLTGTWQFDQKIFWAALYTATGLCRNAARYSDDTDRVSRSMNEDVKRYLSSTMDWCALSGPGAPWQRLNEENIRREEMRKRTAASLYLNPELLKFQDYYVCPWISGKERWDSVLCCHILSTLPLDALLLSTAKPFILNWIEDLTLWACEKISPSWVTSRDRLTSHEGANAVVEAVAGILVIVERHLSSETFSSRFLRPFIKGADTLTCKWGAAYIPKLSGMHLKRGTLLTADETSQLEMIVHRIIKLRHLRYSTSQQSGALDLWYSLTLRGLFLVNADNSAVEPAVMESYRPVITVLLETAGWHNDVFHYYLMACDRYTNSTRLDEFARIVYTVISRKEAAPLWQPAVLEKTALFIKKKTDGVSNLNDELRSILMLILDWLTERGDKLSSRITL